MKGFVSRLGAKHTKVIYPASATLCRLDSLFKKAFYNKKCLLSVVLAAFIFGGIGTTAYAETAPTVQGGIIDLRNWNFDTKGKVALNGTYGFFWNEFLDNWKEPSQYIAVPSSWTHQTAGKGSAYPAKGYATYAVRLLLPQNAPPLSINFHSQFPSLSVFANGVKLTGYDSFVKDFTDVQPTCFALPRGKTQVDLLIQMKSINYAKQGLFTSITLNRSNRLELSIFRNKIIEAMIFSFVLALGLYHLILFVFRPKEISILYFTLLVCIVMLRILSTGRMVGCDLFGLSWITANS